MKSTGFRYPVRPRPISLTHQAAPEIRTVQARRRFIYPIKRQVCFDISLSDVATPMMAHIRQAPALRNGPPIVSLFTGPGSDLDGCAPANTRQLAHMISNPSDYYVSIATTEYPDGALRGQLS